MADRYEIKAGRVKKNGDHYATLPTYLRGEDEPWLREYALSHPGFNYYLLLADYVAAGLPDSFAWTSPEREGSE